MWGRWVREGGQGVPLVWGLDVDEGGGWGEAWGSDLAGDDRGGV